MRGKWEVADILALAIVSPCVNPRCVIGAAEDIRPIAGRSMPLNGIMSPEYPTRNIPQYLLDPGFRRGDKKGRNSKVSIHI
jgi:hypothetical protein